MKSVEIAEKYKAVEGLLEDALNKAESVELVGEEENVELSTISSMLKEINLEFKQEIETLESSSEWDKFCIAFFGETNAGKSTIIESLRIIYDEEQRRVERIKQEKEYETALANHCEQYKELLATLQETNNLLINKEESNVSLQNKILATVRSIALVALGVILGFVIAYWGF